MILEEPVERWPKCECLIAFFSKGFPLEKAIEYATLRKPFVVNDLQRQYALKDRRLVYETLAKAGVPTPRHVALNRDSDVEQTLEEYDDYIVVNGTKVEKPFVEKPVDSDDHNIYIYYPMSAGGGCKRLFRKIGNQSSQYFADENHVRREGSFLYEEFVDTQGTDVKVCGGAGHGRDVGQLQTAPPSVVFHSFRLIFRRASISRDGLEACMVLPERARAEDPR